MAVPSGDKPSLSVCLKSRHRNANAWITRDASRSLPLMANEARIKAVTPDFQVTWTDPADAERTWIYDDIHYNTPMPLLTQDIFYALQIRLDRPTVYLNSY